MRIIEVAKRMIFGVGRDTPATAAATARQVSAESVNFLPESKLTSEQINGGDWKPWRVDGAEQWYQRGQLPTIHGEASEIDFEAAHDRSPSEILEDFRRECSLIKARHARGEMVRQRTIRSEFDDGVSDDDDDA
ncbi:MAG: hypothetical protein U0941_10600 [Planctomycetaceae bacterium]